MDAKSVSLWMKDKLDKDGCLYQDDVVDYLVKAKEESFLKENSEGHLVLEQKLLNQFEKITKDIVVWVMPDKY